MPLPPDLLNAIIAIEGGRVVLIVGAGCSVDAPTSLPLSTECSVDAHRRLLEDGILQPGECANPEDLSSVADAVHARTGQQRELVDRMPRGLFELATANNGYLLAAAMLLEHAITAVMTLNFDLAMTQALGQLGAAGQVSVIAGPEQHDRLSQVNLIYLHRNANADPERWILRTYDLEESWRNGWEGVIAQRVLTGPVTVFAGLGSPAAVLVESTIKIRQAIPNNTSIYMVDPGAPETSRFMAALGLPAESYLRMGWEAFMAQLALRILSERQTDLQRACEELRLAEGWQAENIAGPSARLMELGLVGFGYLRARWTLNNSRYVSHRQIEIQWLGDILLGIALIERTTGTQALFTDDGVIEFQRDDRIVGVIVAASGRGIRRWFALEAEIEKQKRNWENRTRRPRRVLIAGVSGGRPNPPAPPANVVRDEDPASIISGQDALPMYSIDELRQTPALIEGMLS